MKILLDNCVARRFGRQIQGHEVKHASEVDMDRLSNGALLKAAELAGFEVLVTVDKNLVYQQNLRGRSICLVTLSPILVDFKYLLPLLPALESTLQSIQPGQSVVIKPLEDA